MDGWECMGGDGTGGYMGVGVNGKRGCVCVCMGKGMQNFKKSASINTLTDLASSIIKSFSNDKLPSQPSTYISWQASQTSPPLTTPRTGPLRRWRSGRVPRRPATEWSRKLGRRRRLRGSWGHPVLLHGHPHESQSMEYHSITPKKKTIISNTHNTI